MIFSDPSFIVFFVAVLAVYWGVLSWVPGGWRYTLRHVFLLLASYYFYMSWNPTMVLLIIFSTLVDYFVALGIDRTERPATRKALLLASVVTNLGTLGIFKYTNFFLGTISSGAGMVGIEWSFALNILLPVGISFYTFQSMSYTIDVYRGNLKANKNFVTFALYVTFFPQLVAGPIVRATELLPQMARDRTFADANFRVGMNFFLMGLVKKALLSDWISLISDDIFANTALYGTQGNWAGSVAYYVQIYCDFSGYSDMAIGTALMLGFRLSKNFDMPYLSASPTELWRRWHISLSSWLRDYLYISLGGNRGGALFVYRNLFLTMLLAGLWHGAGWNFVLWGSIHGIALAIHRIYSGWFPAPDPARRFAYWARRVVGVILLNLFMLFTWPLFRAETLSGGLTMIRKMIVWDPSNPYVVPVYFWLVLATMAIGHLLGSLFFERLIDEKKPFLPWPIQAVVYALVIALVILFSPSNAQPFIYFQF